MFLKSSVLLSRNTPEFLQNRLTSLSAFADGYSSTAPWARQLSTQEAISLTDICIEERVLLVVRAAHREDMVAPADEPVIFAAGRSTRDNRATISALMSWSRYLSQAITHCVYGRFKGRLSETVPAFIASDFGDQLSYVRRAIIADTLNTWKSLRLSDIMFTRMSDSTPRMITNSASEYLTREDRDWVNRVFF